tara:strand:+ start:699 stop:854 length:156 start_codon:yes stop_codon:yes gene_type:complete
MVEYCLGYWNLEQLYQVISIQLHSLDLKMNQLAMHMHLLLAAREGVAVAQR